MASVDIGAGRAAPQALIIAFGAEPGNEVMYTIQYSLWLLERATSL